MLLENILCFIHLTRLTSANSQFLSQYSVKTYCENVPVHYNGTVQEVHRWADARSDGARYVKAHNDTLIITVRPELQDQK